MTIIKAPAKLSLLGEYAVLRGEEALILAIDRYAYINFTKSDILTFRAKKFRDIEEISKLDPLINHCILEAKNFGLKIPSGKYLIDTSEFHDQESGKKIGIGSSAAVSSLLMAMFYYLDRQSLNIEQIFNLSLAANHNFSKGYGSGMDVAASCFGNAISFKMDGKKTKINQVNLDCLLPYLIFIYTKKEQNTRHFVRKFIESTDKSNKIYTNEFMFIRNSVEKIKKNTMDFDNLLNIWSRLLDIMENIGKMSSIDIVSHEHKQISMIARSFNGEAKPSGAGGGDISLALIPINRQDEFKKEITKNGFFIMKFNQAKFGLSLCKPF